MAYSINHLFHIAATPEAVYAAISTVEGISKWWTVKTSGESTQGGILQFSFGEMQGPEFKVTELIPGKKVSWKCIASPHGWLGHTFTFLLDDNDGKTRLRFAHEGWEAQDDFYAICNFSWGRYMESLRQLCQTGKGEAFGSEGYRK